MTVTSVQNEPFINSFHSVNRLVEKKKNHQENLFLTIQNNKLSLCSKSDLVSTFYLDKGALGCTDIHYLMNTGQYCLLIDVGI